MDSYVSKCCLTDTQQRYLECNLIFEQLWTLCDHPTTKDELKTRLYELRDWGLCKIHFTNPDGTAREYVKTPIEDMHTWMGDNLDSVLQFCLGQGLIVPYKEGDAPEEGPRTKLITGRPWCDACTHSCE